MLLLLEWAPDWRPWQLVRGTQASLETRCAGQGLAPHQCRLTASTVRSMGWACSCMSAKIVWTDILLHCHFPEQLSSWFSKGQWKSREHIFTTNFETLGTKSTQSSVGAVYPSKGPRCCFPLGLLAINLALQDVDSAGSWRLFWPADLLEQQALGWGRRAEEEGWSALVYSRIILGI